MGGIESTIEKSAGGQPTKYKPEYVEEAGELCQKKGYTNKNLAAHFKVNIDTIYTWKKKYSEFSEAIKKGKDVFDTEVVEQALLKRALGYKFDEITQELVEVKDKDGVVTQEMQVTKIVTKHQPSSDVSKIFWLKNRSPDRWSDKKEIEHRIENKEELTEEMLITRLAEIQDAGNGIDMKSIEGVNGNGDTDEGSA